MSRRNLISVGEMADRARDHGFDFSAKVIRRMAEDSEIPATKAPWRGGFRWRFDEERVLRVLNMRYANNFQESSL